MQRLREDLQPQLRTHGSPEGPRHPAALTGVSPQGGPTSTRDPEFPKGWEGRGGGLMRFPRVTR